MSKTNKGILYQFGKELISSMRIRKNNKKAIDMTKTHMLSSDTAFVESARSLERAQQIAEYNKDIDAMLAISDRWAILGRVLESDENIDTRVPIGFMNTEQEAHSHDNS